MPRKTTTYTILISCPSDIKEEVKIIEEVLKGFNENFGKNIGMSLEYSYWKKDVMPQHGDRPQEIINKQIVRDSDAIIAIFGEKFGSDTGKYPSGTIEEIEEMIKSKKQVFLYFSEKPIEREDMYSKVEELEKIERFKKEYGEKGIYSVYKSDNEFKENITKHIEKYFSNIKNTSIPNSNELIIKSYNNNSLEPYLQYYNILNYDEIIENKKNIIIDLIDNIKEIDVGMPSSFINGQVESIRYIKDYYKILDFTCKFKIFIDENNFFNLNGYRKFNEYDMHNTLNQLGVNANINHIYEKEKFKYKRIVELINSIDEYNSIEKYFQYLKTIKFLSLAVINDGDYNENINITLNIPADYFIDIKDIQEPDSNLLKLINDNIDKYIFQNTMIVNSITIDSNNDIRKKENSIVETIQSYYSKYTIYNNNGIYNIIFKIEKLNSGSGIWFPTILFFKEIMDEIEYSITSKNTTKINGVIKIK